MINRRLPLALLVVVIAASCARPPVNRPVIVIGWDGADWQLLDELMAQGSMPELSALVSAGTAGTLRTIHPPLSPIVWTTMMTGRGPLDHGVLDFTRFDPASRIREPIGSAERRVPAVWTIASTARRTVGVFGMWATYPAEAVSGVMVSDRLMSFQNDAQPAASRAVFPETRQAWAEGALAKAEAAADAAALDRYAPGIARDARLSEGLRRVLVATAVYDDLAASWFDEAHPDLTILYVQGTDAIGHLFAPYRPPPMKGVAAEAIARWGRVPDLYYAEADRRLGAWRRRAEKAGAALVLVSDHGFTWGAGRPAGGGSAAAATAGRWHRDDGIYVLVRPGVVAGGAARGHGEAAQVAPTLLALLGLPSGRAMPEPLAGITPAPGSPAEYAAPTAAPGAAPEHGDDPTASEAIANLRTLGYVGAAEPDRPSGLDPASTRTAGSWSNEGLIVLEAGRTAEAKAAFEHALTVDPQHAASLWNLAQLLAGEGDAAAEPTLLRAVAAGSADAAKRLSDRARERLQAGDCRGALNDVLAVAAANPSSAVAPAAEGLARMCLGDPVRAAAALRRSLAIDPDQPEIVRALGSLR